MDSFAITSSPIVGSSKNTILGSCNREQTNSHFILSPSDKEEYLNKIISKVVNEFNVIDINISKVSIDDIIKRCYMEK